MNETSSVRPRGSSYIPSKKDVVNLESFEFVGELGEGAYGKVYMAKKTSTGKFYAIKCLQKRKLMQEGK